MDIFRVRLNCIDHYQADPTPYDPQLRRDVAASQRQNEPKVPVIRVFGSTETGQKVCAHIHGAFPYLYIEYTGSLDQVQVGAYIHHLHLSIDHALGVSYRRNVYDGKNLYVARITLVKGIPFYGYHVGYQYFLKIYMLNPVTITRVSDLLRQGVIMKKTFQPHESHLQYLLQWMTDYNLYGCGYIDCRKVYFRSPVPRYEDIDDDCHLWHDQSIPPEYILGEDVLQRVSHCAIEVDICVQDILNRMEIKPRQLHHDFVERLNCVPTDEKLVHSMAGLWRDETRRRKSRMVDPEPGSSPFPAEVLISMSAGPRNSQRGGWIHEDDYRDKVISLISKEREDSGDASMSFGGFVKPVQFEDSVKTAFESIEDLYPQNLGPIFGLKYDTIGSKPNEDVKIDINQATGFPGVDDDDFQYDDFQYDSDVELILAEQLAAKKSIEYLGNAQVMLADAGRFKDVVGDESRLRGEKHDGRLVDPMEPYLVGKVKADEHDIPITSYSPQSKFSDASFFAEGSPISSSYARTGEKRSGSQGTIDNGYIKRQRVGRQASGPGLKHSEALKHEDQDRATGFEFSESIAKGRNDARMQSDVAKFSAPYGGKGGPGPATLPKKSSQEVLKSTGSAASRTLTFPVVKDPQDLSTILRLSQGSLSQKSTETTHNRQVSFETPIQPPRALDKSPSIEGSSIDSGRSDNDVILSQVMENVKMFYSSPPAQSIMAIKELPPMSDTVVSTMEEFDLPSVIYQDAYYSHETDVPTRAREYAGREFKLESSTVPFLPDFDASGLSPATFGKKSAITLDKAKNEAFYQKRRRLCGLRSWEIGEPPPTSEEVMEWLNSEHALKSTFADEHPSLAKSGTSPHPRNKLSQIEGPSQKNKYGFKYTQLESSTSVQYEVQYMSTMSLEVHVNTRSSYVPNPEEDEIQCVFWCLQSDEQDSESNGIAPAAHVGIITLSEDGSIAKKIAREVDVEVKEETSELDLLIRIVQIVRTHDPDILTGYEVHGSSWGYLIERARLKYDYDLCDELSRMKAQSHGRSGRDNDKWGFTHTSTIRVTGRHMINIWRAMRGELNLLQYTMENVSFHLLHRRIPHYSWRDLTLWYTNGKPKDLAKVLKHYILRVQLDLEILERNELIPRTSEQARLLGVDFFSVFSRGSQFKVESLMFRIAKPENFILASPSKKQVGGQNALECLPLVMEPRSAFYNSPLLVLDFQSLYPSIMIAYNYCYSTFLGRIINWRGTSKMGFTDYKRQRRLLELLQDHINIAPNGMMYVKPNIRKSLLAKMLGEILETRVMVKSGMKIDKDDKTLQRLLNNRQLALKLIANVTYGYTSASFSGRMPCSEIADSIVQSARETLERAIALIHSVESWGAEVVYGDTDSLFIYLKGRTKDQAFDIGNEIVKKVTDMNPRPIKLKFEKVYLPCVLLAKKRYVGFKYESRDQEEPEFDAKGIETVRRDGTPAEQKIEEKALKILFRTADLSQVKGYFQKQCEKIMKGSVSIQDFCFAKEVRLGTYSEKGVPTPGALISARRMLEDARAEPQYGERVPYVVITGAPGARLIDRCVAPEKLLYSDDHELDAEYYISKNIIPPLERIFNLMGANVRNWYDEMPKIQRVRKVNANLQLPGAVNNMTRPRRTLESYMRSSSCLLCREKTTSAHSVLCAKCVANRPVSLLTLRTRLSRVEKRAQDLERVCQSCSGIPWSDEVKCDSKDCPVFYSRIKQRAVLKREQAVIEPATLLLQKSGGRGGGLDW